MRRNSDRCSIGVSRCNYRSTCTFCTPFGVLLSHIVCKEELLVDPSQSIGHFEFANALECVDTAVDIGTHRVLPWVSLRLCRVDCNRWNNCCARAFLLYGLRLVR